jgi:hypothetical protein
VREDSQVRCVGVKTGRAEGWRERPKPADLARGGLRHHLDTGQGSKSILDKLEHLIQSGDGEDTPGRRTDATKDQPVPRIQQHLPQFQESGKSL